MDYYNINDFISSMKENRKPIEDMVFFKVRESISLKTEKTFLFSISTEGETMSFYLNRSQYNYFLDTYLKSCESAEDYETCSQILELKKILLSD